MSKEKELRDLLRRAMVALNDAIPVDSQDNDLYQEINAALTTPSPAPSNEVLRPEVLAFAHLMEAQLKANDHRGGWKDCTESYLRESIRSNMRDMTTYRGHEDWAGYRRTCADIANFAMMLADNAPLPPAKDERGA